MRNEPPKNNRLNTSYVVIRTTSLLLQVREAYHLVTRLFPMPIIAYLPYSDNTTFFDIFPNSSYLLLFTGWGEVPEGTPCSKAEHPVLYSFKAGRYQLWKKASPACLEFLHPKPAIRGSLFPERTFRNPTP